MKLERGVAGVGDVLGVLDADDPEVGLLPGGAEDLAGGEELAAVQAAGEVEDARALHHGVVDVEERRRGRVGRGARARSRPRRPPRRPPRRGSSAAAGSAGRRGLSRGHARIVGPGRRRLRGRVEGSPPCPQPSDPPAGPGRPGRRPPRPSGPTPSPSVEAGGRSADLGRARGRGGRIATGLGEAGIVGGHRVLIALRQPARVRHDVPRRAARPGRRRPRQPALDGRRARPDGRRLRAPGWRSPTPTTLAAVREAVALVARRARRRDGDLDADLVERAAPTRVVVVDERPADGEQSLRRRCGPPSRAPVPPLPDPEKLAVPPLHQRHVRPAARRDAHPPGAAGQHRAGGRASSRR